MPAERLQKIRVLRDEIDAIDLEILELLSARGLRSLAVRRLKQEAGLPIFDPKREDEIIRSLQEANQGPLPDDALRDIYRVLLRSMKELPEDA